jgi:conjugal transfer pilus assembly protein TraU
MFKALLLSVSILASVPVYADTVSSSTDVSESPTCPKVDVFSMLFDQICWDGVFPISFPGFGPVGGTVPDGAGSTTGFDDTICNCPDKNGVPKFGFSAAFNNPSRMMEVVRTPHCYPLLGGAKFSNSFAGQGLKSNGKGEAADKGFYQYHYYAFPLTAMLELLDVPNCNSEGFVDMDLINMSEYNPAHSDDELAFFMTMESIVLGALSPICIADCASATFLEHPLEPLYFCAGCWGSLYPFTGNILTDKSMPRDTSLLTARALALMHRMGMAKKSMGNGAKCGGTVSPMVPKSQYKFSMIYPIAEASPDCTHVWGENTLKWGEWRNIPRTGEDAIYLIFKYTDCCLM